MRLFARDPETVAAIDRGENPRYLPGIAIAPGIDATSDIAAALAGADCVLAVTPAQSLRATLAVAKGSYARRYPVVLCAKGIERDTGALLSAIVEEILPRNPVAALSGPSFATDIARGLPTAVVVAARDEALAATSPPAFRRESALLFERRPDRRRDRRRLEERLRHCRRCCHAVESYHRAAVVAARVFAHAEAIRLHRAALDQLAGLVPGEERDRARDPHADRPDRRPQRAPRVLRPRPGDRACAPWSSPTGWRPAPDTDALVGLWASHFVLGDV